MGAGEDVRGGRGGVWRGEGKRDWGEGVRLWVVGKTDSAVGLACLDCCQDVCCNVVDFMQQVLVSNLREREEEEGDR